MKAVARHGLRARLLLSVLVTIGFVLGGLTAGFNLVLANRLDAEANSVVSARASAELAALHVVSGRIVLPEAPDEGSPDTSIWVFQGTQAIELPRGGDTGLVAALAARAPASHDSSDARLRLDALPVAAGGHRVGAVVAGVSLAPYRQAQRTALIASLLLALVAFIAVGLAANWLIRRALRPIAMMTRLAAEWSEHDIDRRFAQGPPRDEFTELAFTLDGLLERLATSLRHEQRLSAELSHELRTPLANVAAEAQYALRHGDPSDEARQALDNILASAHRMTRTLETLIAAARAELDSRGATSDPAAAAQAAALACAALAAGQGVQIVVQPPPTPTHVAVEQHLVERMLAPLLENACRHAERRIDVRIEHSSSRVLLIVEDDGAGIPLEDLERIFEPGWQGRSTGGATTQVVGAGLGLALARRLARNAGGEVRAEPSDAGARLAVELPLA
jgi:signal transduction histidine kinase